MDSFELNRENRLKIKEYRKKYNEYIEQLLDAPYNRENFELLKSQLLTLNNVFNEYNKSVDAIIENSRYTYPVMRGEYIN